MNIESRKTKLRINTISSLLFQMSTIICGFITPKLLLFYYGSEVNGLVASITQFLSLIAFLELGVGAVVQSSFYKPLADNDVLLISKIMASAEKFFRRLAVILLVYGFFLIIIYPLVVKNDFDILYTATLIAAMSISSFAQYYFGVTERLLLSADQRGYIQYNAQTITLVVNTIASAVLILQGAPIQLVKLVTSLIYLVRPFILRIYVNNHYQIDRHVKYSSEPIQQKWNGVAQHIAAVVLDGTDNVVLTLFATLADVSIYSVYYLVVYGVKSLFMSMTNGIQALTGELWAKQEIAELNQFFGRIEWYIHTGTTFIFGCTASLILPFVCIYTAGVHDTNYTVPLFALLITLANGFHCLRLPYNIMILSAGHYRQTQYNYIIAAGLNVIVSIATVKMWGLVGVAIGTLIAMLYQTIWMAVYNSKNILCWPICNFLKQIFVDTVSFVLAFSLSTLFHLGGESYLLWIILAIKTTFIWGVIILCINCIVYKENVQLLISSVLKKFVMRGR